MYNNNCYILGKGVQFGVLQSMSRITIGYHRLTNNSTYIQNTNEQFLHRYYIEQTNNALYKFVTVAVSFGRQISSFLLPLVRRGGGRGRGVRYICRQEECWCGSGFEEGRGGKPFSPLFEAIFRLGLLHFNIQFVQLLIINCAVLYSLFQPYFTGLNTSILLKVDEIMMFKDNLVSLKFC